MGTTRYTISLRPMEEAPDPRAGRTRCAEAHDSEIERLAYPGGAPRAAWYVNVEWMNPETMAAPATTGETSLCLIHANRELGRLLAEW